MEVSTYESAKLETKSPKCAPASRHKAHPEPITTAPKPKALRP